MDTARIGMAIRWRCLVPVLLATMLSSCFALGTMERLQPCCDGHDELGSQFRLLCWNIHKSGAALDELRQLPESPEVLCFQEWSGEIPAGEVEIRGAAYGGWFGKAWRSFAGAPTGVATFARVEPDWCRAQRSGWREGWFFTPKCALLTCFPMAGRSERLLVVNVHAMNFQWWWTYMLDEQIRRLAKTVRAHRGPAIVCGDFNTWRSDRLAVVREALADMEEVDFAGEPTTGSSVVWAAMGTTTLPIDRVFYRGLAVVGTGEVRESVQSDHRPLLVTFRCAEPVAANSNEMAMATYDSPSSIGKGAVPPTLRAYDHRITRRSFAASVHK